MDMTKCIVFMNENINKQVYDRKTRFHWNQKYRLLLIMFSNQIKRHYEKMA